MSKEKNYVPIEEEQEEKKKKRKRWLLLLILLLLLLCGGCTYRYIIKDNGVSNGEIGSGVLKGMSYEEMQKYLNEKTDASVFQIDINPIITFENAKSEGYLRLINRKSSAYNIKFTLKIDETGEVIYKSPTLTPTQYIQYVKLDKKLKAGTYRCTGTYEFYKADEPLKKVSQQHVAIEVTIEK